MSDETQTGEGPANLRGRRKWLFRIAAILIGVSPFLLAELSVRVSGWRPPIASSDPFVGFQGITPLFEAAADGIHMEIPPSRREFFEPDRFLISKPRNEFRIFCLGGSTVQGRPYSLKTSFTTWLELSLAAADPSRQWNAVNCGGVSYASYRIAPILEECLNYQPDMIIIYTGHNEFLEDRSYQDAKSPSALALATHRITSKSRLFQLAAALRAKSRKPRTILSQEVDALLDYQGGLETYHRNPEWREQVVAHYATNLQRMLQLARDAAVPVLLINPVSNLRDCPPFKVELDPAFSKDQATQFTALMEQAKSAIRDQENPAAIDLLKRALQLDQSHAGAWFLLGHCYLNDQQSELAREAFIQAKDADVCPLRMTEPLHAALKKAAVEFKTPLLDARAMVAEQASQGIAGDRELVDHVHPSIEGHQAIAQLIFDQMVDDGFLRTSELHRSAKQKAFREHWRNEIDETYMARGQQKLEGLRRWASGRAYKVRRPQEGFN